MLSLLLQLPPRLPLHLLLLHQLFHLLLHLLFHILDVIYCPVHCFICCSNFCPDCHSICCFSLNCSICCSKCCPSTVSSIFFQDCCSICGFLFSAAPSAVPSAASSAAIPSAFFFALPRLTFSAVGYCDSLTTAYSLFALSTFRWSLTSKLHSPLGVHFFRWAQICRFVRVSERHLSVRFFEGPSVSPFVCLTFCPFVHLS